MTGTVLRHELDYNVPAQNGPWAAYEIAQSDDILAWFACHVDVDPLVEIDRILRVSGSVSDVEPGHLRNNNATLDAGILVINRYD